MKSAVKDAAASHSARHKAAFASGNLLVSFEIALALALTLGAGLLLNSFVRLMRVDPGFQPQGLFAAIIILPRAQYPDAASNRPFFRRVIENLEATPGITAAVTSNSVPLSGQGNGAHIKIEGHASATEDDPANLCALHFVSVNYTRTMEIPLLRGRAFTTQDTASATAVALINQAAAQRFWPGADPLGQRIRFGQGQWHQVVGIVSSTHLKQLAEIPGPEVYIPVEQAPIPTNFLIVRSTLPQANVTDALRRAVTAVDPQQPIFHTMSMESMLADTVANQRFSLWLLGAFSTLALLLAAFGIYGVVAYTVVQRTREIGIRLALGAQGHQVLRLIMRQGLKPVAIGSLGGLFLAWGFSLVLSGLLYEVETTDPATIVGVVLFLLFIAILACWIPARRVTKLDPLIVLRRE